MDLKAPDKPQIHMREVPLEDPPHHLLGFYQMSHIPIQLPRMSSELDPSTPLQTIGPAKVGSQK